MLKYKMLIRSIVGPHQQTFSAGAIIAYNTNNTCVAFSVQMLPDASLRRLLNRNYPTSFD